ncbi:cytochrome b5 [Roridomyces roridus]|uniref:Cytochrome b5 n=1 Tax=Roridomyces roridus TaxID=1738132 RepID=A0AAD7C5T0_9AGAR|nr:cytochrome b5 [Roridomyces roridus]
MSFNPHPGAQVPGSSPWRSCAKDRLYVLIHQGVYDVTEFLDEHRHPRRGWCVSIFSRESCPFTEAFEHHGHSEEARAFLPGMFVGGFERGQQTSNVIYYYAPLGLLGAWLAYRYFTTGAL